MGARGKGLLLEERVVFFSALLPKALKLWAALLKEIEFSSEYAGGARACGTQLFLWPPAGPSAIVTQFYLPTLLSEQLYSLPPRNC